MTSPASSRSVSRAPSPTGARPGHPGQRRPAQGLADLQGGLLDALAPDARDIETASQIILAADAVDWAPISHAGQLHDRASYRYYWTVLQRAKQTGQALPKEADGLL